MGTTNLKEFVGVFSNAVLKSLPKRESTLKAFMTKISSLRPSLTFDSLSGEPRISLDIRNEKETEASLELIFSLIARNSRFFVVAIDEFQQIENYPEKNVEALLRGHIQQLSNICFIFSGSKKHMLSAMFSHASRPFFNSTEMMFLKEISAEDYFPFIVDLFHSGGKTIDETALGCIQKYTALHTFYVQFLCNRLFSRYKKVGEKEDERGEPD